MIRELIDLAPGFNREEQANFISKYGGLIFIDEIDKKAKDGALIGHDISREGFQRWVGHKFLEWAKTQLPMSKSESLAITGHFTLKRKKMFCECPLSDS